MREFSMFPHPPPFLPGPPHHQNRKGAALTNTMANLNNHEPTPMMQSMPDSVPKTAKPAPDADHCRPNAPSYVYSAGNKTAVRRARRKADSIWTLYVDWMNRNQINLAFSLLTLLVAAHLVPNIRPHTIKFVTLSYYNPTSEKYGHGIDDAFFVFTMMVLFTGSRAVAMKYILVPLARQLGIKKNKAIARFSDQSWLLCYYTVSWTLGMYIYSHSSYWLNLKNLWTDWPKRELDGLVKFYILGQLGFYLHQTVIIEIEEHGKDYVKMMIHHFVTSSLIYACYAYHQTRVGNVILVIMDFVDIILPLAKCLKYIGFKTVCDVLFGVFLVSWIATRHVAYSLVCWSIYADIPIVIGNVCWRGSGQDLVGPAIRPEGYGYLLEPFWDAKGLVCFGHVHKWLFLFPLLILQVLNFIWLAMIGRIALRVIRRQGAEDTRSDDEAPGKE